MKWNIPQAHFLCGIWHVVDIHPFNESDADESNAMGFYKDDGREIHIDASQPEHTWLEIWLHECIHGIDSIHDLGLKHYQICTLAAQIHDLLRNQLPDSATKLESEGGGDE